MGRPNRYPREEGERQVSPPDPARTRRGDGADLTPEKIRRLLAWLDSMPIRDPGQAVEREVVTAEEEPFEAVWFRGEFGYGEWEKHRVSHARIVLRDHNGRAGEVADLWAPAALVPVWELARANGVEQLDLAARGGTQHKPYRAAEWICLTDSDEVSFMERDPPAPVFYVLREYYNVAGGVVLVDERRMRDDTVFRYDRSLPWERGMLREFFREGLPGPWTPRDRGERRP